MNFGSGKWASYTRLQKFPPSKKPSFLCTDTRDGVARILIKTQHLLEFNDMTLPKPTLPEDQASPHTAAKSNYTPINMPNHVINPLLGTNSQSPHLPLHLSTNHTATINDTTPRGLSKTIKINWTENLNLSLLREFSAVGAYMPGKCEMLLKFVDVGENLNVNKHLALPWVTDARNCRQRFQLLMEKWEISDKCKAIKSGGGEQFGELQHLCVDI